MNNQIQIVEVHVEGYKGHVILESSSQEALQSADARRIAIAEGQRRGMNSPGTSQLIHPYPVDANGEAITTLGVGTQAAAGYRAKYTLTSSV